MRIFLTGGTGFIGRPLTKALRDRDWDVTALVRNPENAGAKAIQAIGAQLVSGDVTDRESMRPAMAGADAVIHNAGWYEIGIPDQAYDRMRAINVQGTENTLGLAIELGVPKIVYTSTMLVYGATGDIVGDETYHRNVAPLTHYEKTKVEAHEFAKKLQQDGAPVVIVCPAGVIGPGDPSGLGYLLRMYVRGFLPPMLWGAKGTHPHVYVDDAAEGIVRCLEFGKVGETYILSNGTMTNQDMFNIWKGTPGGFKRILFWMPDWMAMLFNASVEPFERLLGLPNVFSREFGRMSCSKWQYSAAKAEQELGMQFRSIEQAWLDTLAGERRIAGKA
jgi:nucleoside-diphosphate-sugar epimerase